MMCLSVFVVFCLFLFCATYFNLSLGEAHRGLFSVLLCRYVIVLADLEFVINCFTLLQCIHADFLARAQVQEKVWSCTTLAFRHSAALNLSHPAHWLVRWKVTE